MAVNKPTGYVGWLSAFSLLVIMSSGCGTSAGIELTESEQKPAAPSTPISETAQRTSEQTTLATANTNPNLQATPNGLPLLQPRDLSYLGAFRMPELPYTGNVCDSLTYSGRGIAVDPAGNAGAGSLFISGHAHCGARIGEISIPDLVNSSDLQALKRATLLQTRPSTLRDGLEGNLENSGLAGGTNATVNGLMVNGDTLVISAGNDYTYSQPVSHWTRPKDLSVTGQVSRAIAVRGDRSFNDPRGTAGYMCHVPTSLQAQLGGPALTGWVAESIVSATSDGPAAFVFDPADLGKGTSLSVKTLLFYPHGYSLEPSIPGQSTELWNWTSIVRGCAVPEGTRTVLFFGTHGTGTFLYGVGGANGKENAPPYRPIYDPSDTSTGEHAWPYRYQIWAYDAHDLMRARLGEIAPHSLRPYASWRVRIPLEKPEDRHHIGGAVYDARAKRLYFVQQSAGPFGEIVVHALQVADLR